MLTSAKMTAGATLEMVLDLLPVRKRLTLKAANRWVDFHRLDHDSPLRYLLNNFGPNTLKNSSPLNVLANLEPNMNKYINNVEKLTPFPCPWLHSGFNSGNIMFADTKEKAYEDWKKWTLTQEATEIQYHFYTDGSHLNGCTC
jgi:hypothetical protein